MMTVAQVSKRTGVSVRTLTPVRLLTCATVIIRIPPLGSIIYYDVTSESRGFYRLITTFF